jgi:tetratricopeptide (TPR) repeat protein
LAVLDQPVEQALALRLLGLTEMGRNDNSLATQALTSSRTVASRAGDRRSEAWALQSLAWHAFVRGKVDSARELADQAIDIFAELNDRTGLAWARGVQAWVAFHSNRWDTARELVDAVLPEARRQADPQAESLTLNLAASLALWSGQAGRAEELARNAQQVAELAEDHALRINSMALEGRALVSLGRIAAGTELLENAFVTADRLDERDARRIAIISNCASAARLGEPERAIRWAARFDGQHDDPTSVGEADLAVSLALALLQRGAVDEAEGQLSWSEPGGTDPAGRYQEAVAAIIAAVRGDHELVERRVQRVLTDGSTYLDRVLALSARAASRVQRGDTEGCERALAEAGAELESTDDKPSRLILGLVTAICLRGDIDEAMGRIESGGFDGTGWRTVWTLATRPSIRS